MKRASAPGPALCGAFLLALAGCASKAPPPASSYAPAPAGPGPSYVFAWPFIETGEMAPRGGTTRGGEVTPIQGPSENWTRLRAPGLDAFQRDRAAILAMAGDYRASFDFLETAVFIPGKQAAPARPYRSWGTERIYVAADSGTFISLQHIMVMFFEDEKGVRQGPMVMKHWRQDWRYEPASLYEYRGRSLWARRELGKEERKGSWSQSVYHVDDSPRYASSGRWEHNASFSAWTGDSTRRPLPRREHTVRSDYQALAARNRQTLLPTGWLHEQDNLKLVLDSAGNPDSTLPYLAREAGVDRYDLISGFDFSAGDEYWKGTGPFWAKVRARWERTLYSRPQVRVSDMCRGKPAFSGFFGLADSTAGPRPPSDQAVNAELDSLFSCILAD